MLGQTADIYRHRGFWRQCAPHGTNDAQWMDGPFVTGGVPPNLLGKTPDFCRVRACAVVKMWIAKSRRRTRTDGGDEVLEDRANVPDDAEFSLNAAADFGSSRTQLPSSAPNSSGAGCGLRALAARSC